MSEQQLNGELVQRFLDVTGHRSETLASQLDISMSTLRRLILTGKLPKRRREWRLKRLAAITGLSIDEILIPESTANIA